MTTVPFTTPPTFDSQGWLARWDAQQSGYLPDREVRFQIMFDILGVALPESFVAVDLGCGPGSLSQRLLARFPSARCVAVDLDPVLLAMGRAVLGDIDGRLGWVDADLMAADELSARLGLAQVDAVLSTTALHWLPDEKLYALYQQLGHLLRPGGIVLNGDNFGFTEQLPTFRDTAHTLTEQRRADAFERRGVENWERWWEALRAEPGMEPLFAERDRRFTWRIKKEYPTTYEVHAAAFHAAGFREAGVIWQNLDNRVIMAVR